MPRYTLREVDVDFPYEAYPCQLDYMTRVIEALDGKKNALLESPTGTGKTLCLLCASLAWREAQRKKVLDKPEAVKMEPNAKGELVQKLREDYAQLLAERAAQGGDLPTIVYSSRTHSQLKQVMKELSTTAYTPRVAVLGSRQQSCLNPEVSAMPAGAANQACRSLVSKRGCKWHYNVERYLKANPDTNTSVMDIEDLGKLGQQRTVCPYYLSRDMAATAELVFMPYNYLVDVKTRGGLGITWDNAVLIFDEAHNVEGICSDAASFDLPAAILAGAIEEAGTAAELAASRADGARFGVADEYGKTGDGASMLALSTNLHTLRRLLQKLEQEIAQVVVTPDRGFAAPGIYLFQLLEKLNLTQESWIQLSSVMEQATSMLTDDAVQGGRRHGSRASTYRLNALHEALTLAFSTLDPPREGDVPSHLHYRVHIGLERARHADRALPTLGYWCFNPGLAMKALQDTKVRSILLTSGTLSPLGSFAQELGVPFPIRLENPHVIDPRQVWIGVVCKGPRGSALNSSYNNRNNADYKTDLGNAIVNFARIVPDGLLVFFPSYVVLTTCVEAWKAPGPGGQSIWDRIGFYKAPVMEPREAALFPAAAADFRAKLDDPAYKGAVFFAVCRGKASEGLDFSDRAGRAVIITGIPYAMKVDPKVKLKQETLDDALRASQRRKRSRGGAPGGASSSSAAADEELLSGDSWYVQQALRAVNQAMGRVIRHRRDYGAIILCDERFKQENVRRQMSKWLRDSVVVHQAYGPATASLTKFFKDQAEAARQGLVGDGGQSGVPGAHAPPSRGVSTFGAASGPGAGSSSRAFEIAARRPDPGVAAQAQALVRLVPAAAAVAGLSELVGAAVGGPSFSSSSFPSRGGDKQGAGGSDAAAVPPKPGLISLLEGAAGRSDSSGAAAARGRADSGSRADGLLEGLGAVGEAFAPRRAPQPMQSAAAAGLRPWERAAAALPPRQSAAQRSLGLGGGGGSGGDTVVGPRHLIEKHQQQAQQQGERQRSVERQEPAIEAPAAAAAAVIDDNGAIEEREAAVMGEQEHEPASPGAFQQRRQEAGADFPALGKHESAQHRQPAGADPMAARERASLPPEANAMPPPPPQQQQPAAPVKHETSLMQRLKTELPAAGSKRVIAALRQYTIDKEAEPLLRCAADVLHPPQHESLLMQFRKSVPSRLLPHFTSLVQKAATAADRVLNSSAAPPPRPPGQASATRKVVAPGSLGRVSRPVGPGSSGSGAARATATAILTANKAAAAAAGRGPSSSKAQPSAAAAARDQPCVSAPTTRQLPACGACSKRPMNAPHQAACCKGVMCNSCGLRAVALRACTMCKRPLKKNMLTPKQQQF